MEEELRVHRVPLVSLDLLEELAHPAQLVQWESPDHLELLEKKVQGVFEETMDLLGNKESEDQQVHLAAQETKETLERMDQRVLMVHQAQLELLDREELWDFRVREESVGCQAFQVQRVHQEKLDPQEHLEIKAPQAQLVLLG